MKYLLTVLLLLMGILGYAQVRRQGNDFYAPEKEKATKAETLTPFTYHIGDNDYPIYVSTNGRAYIWRISTKTGKPYKFYLSEDTSREICEDLHITYVEHRKVSHDDE